jgi:zinc protease
MAADLLVELAFGETSDIYKALVIERQAVEFLTAYTNTNRDPSLLDIYCRIKDPSLVEAVGQALDEAAAKFRETRVAARQLEDLKSRLRYSFLMDLETPESVARIVARPISLAGHLDQLEARYAAYEAVSAEDLRDAAQLILLPERRTVGLLRARQ